MYYAARLRNLPPQWMIPAWMMGDWINVWGMELLRVRNSRNTSRWGKRGYRCSVYRFLMLGVKEHAAILAQVITCLRGR